MALKYHRRARDMCVKRNNRNAKRCCYVTEDGTVFNFPSHLERDRFIYLLMLQDAGEITDLKTQTEFPCEINGRHVCSYRADFTYRRADGSPVVEDTKGYVDRHFRLKKKVVEALWDVKIIVVGRDRDRGWYEKKITQRG
jgi:hypothetical protein